MDANIAFRWEKHRSTAESAVENTAESAAYSDKVNSRDVVKTNLERIRSRESENMTPAKLTPNRLNPEYEETANPGLESDNKPTAPAPLGQAKYDSSLYVGAATTDLWCSGPPSNISILAKGGGVDAEDGNTRVETIINAFGILHIITSRSSWASITPVSMMISSAAVGLDESSLDSHSLVGFPL